jgi:hypothetical protein
MLMADGDFRFTPVRSLPDARRIGGVFRGLRSL